MKKKILLLFLLFFIKTSFSQVLSWSPYLTTVNDTIEIIYDASKGNKALVGVFPIYAHTGVITNLSTSSSDWKHVKTNWGQNTNETMLTYISGTLYKIKIPIKSYYAVPSGETILKLAFVFRNSDGSLVGRDTDGSDIFIPIYPSGLNTALVTSYSAPFFPALNDTIKGVAYSSKSKTLALYKGDVLIGQTTGNTLNFAFTASEYGKKRIRAVATDSNNAVKVDSFYYVVNSPNVVAAVPAGIKDGINYTGNSSVTLSLYAPDKSNVYVLGDFNNWEADPKYMMKKTSDNKRYWLEIDSLTEKKEYIFQYLVDGSLRIADPYTEKVSDPWNDSYIDSNTYPGLISYPSDKTNQIASTLQINPTQYVWQATNYKRPEKSKLVIYELLVRDFVATHNYKTLSDTLQYLKNLGVNAIELMPISEFEGNDSWGYNPAFYFAPDKYYGPKNDLKAFIDKAHQMGIAVLMDMVLNHSFGSSPMVRLYFDSANNEPTANSPWFNQVATHPYNVGYDFNHESQATKDFVDRVTSFWLQEYKIDGYRFDLSKGFTQFNSGSNVSLWGQYDQSRINIWKRISDAIRSVDSTSFIILEHFADNSEQKVLSSYGLMMWGNLNSNYNEATMGYFDNNKSDLSYGYYKTLGWSDPNLVTYMESHDEERLMYKNLQYGNSSGSYNIKTLSTALDRIKLAAAFFFTIPGPKMIWQFGELGYDITIDSPSRTGDKPILWSYYSDPARKNLYKTFAALIKLKTNYPAFDSGTVVLDVTGAVKRIIINHSSMHVRIVGNFDVTPRTVNPNFDPVGIWYDYFTGASVNVTDPQAVMPINPGEFHIYTSVKLPVPEPGIVSGIEGEKEKTVIKNFALEQNYPNPFNPTTVIEYQIPQSAFVTLKVYDILGREVSTLVNESKQAGQYKVEFNALSSKAGKNLASGIYIYKLQAGSFVQSKKLILMK
jgi:1,4-alpha-glucan branching enzyme